MSAQQSLAQKFFHWILEQPYWWPFWLIVLLAVIAVVAIYLRIRQALRAFGLGNSHKVAFRDRGNVPLPRGIGAARKDLQQFSRGTVSPAEDHILTRMGQNKKQVTQEDIAKALDIYCSETGASRDGNYAYDYKDQFTNRYVIISDMSKPVNNDYLATIDLQANWGKGAIHKQAQQ